MSKTPPAPPILDIRPLTLYEASHFPGATHFPGLTGPNGLSARLHELPAPNISPLPSLSILAQTEHEADAAVALLQPRGYSAHILLTNLLHQFPTESGTDSRTLWSPAPLVRSILPDLLTAIPKQNRTALDIGAGCGRDSAYLASHGFRVVSVERDTSLTAKAKEFGEREAREGGSVTAISRTFGKHMAGDGKWLRQNAAMLLVVVRFLRRGVLEVLHEGVMDGGFVIYEHFLVGCEQFGGPKKRSQMLEMGELQQTFSTERGFRVIREDEQCLDDGRPIVRFVARRDLR